jgi:uncharacterized membrane protein YoaK (UPF0700 family)
MGTGRAESGRSSAETLLVPILLTMTLVTGGVDAVSILRLGHVFVANMTGNVVFLGFSLAGSAGFSATASLAALGSFLVGAAVGGRMFASSPPVKRVSRVAACEAVLCVAAALVAAATTGTAGRYTMTVLLSLAMGWQNALARSLAVPDLTTTVLTLTLTGLVADRADVRAPRSHTRRRLAAVAAMLIGAVGGALLVLHASTTWALVAAGVLLAAIAVAAGRRTAR